VALLVMGARVREAYLGPDGSDEDQAAAISAG
jgi:hypothetical protein